jgi:hypothetical protein
MEKEFVQFFYVQPFFQILIIFVSIFNKKYKEIKYHLKIFLHLNTIFFLLFFFFQGSKPEPAPLLAGNGRARHTALLGDDRHSRCARRVCRREHVCLALGVYFDSINKI